MAGTRDSTFAFSLCAVKSSSAGAPTASFKVLLQLKRALRAHSRLSASRAAESESCPPVRKAGRPAMQGSVLAELDANQLLVGAARRETFEKEICELQKQV
jgi:hypothetical protein